MTKGNQEKRIQVAAQGHLVARPMQVVKTSPLGLQTLGIDSEGDGFLYVPKSYQVEQPAPLVLMLHGAGGNASGAMAPFFDFADAYGLILLAPDSRQKTWDLLYGGYGPDIALIDEALAQTFSRYAVDPTHIAIEGFSDGASYALSVGIGNGDLFTHIIAFSPGFIAPVRKQSLPRIFISHGQWDNVLRIDRCSRKIVPRLQATGYDVLYEEFNGFHTVPPNIAHSALTWFTA